MKFLKINLILSAFALFIFACGQASKTDTTINNAVSDTNSVVNTKNADSTPVDELVSGKNIFMEQCSKCHKESGTGGKVTFEGKTINAENLTADKMKKGHD